MSRWAKLSILSVAVCMFIAMLCTQAMAALGDHIGWIDSIPDLRVISTEDTGRKLEKKYVTTNPDKIYKQILDGVKKNGWTVRPDGDDDDERFADIKCRKNNLKMTIELDDEHFQGDKVYVLEVEIKTIGR